MNTMVEAPTVPGVTVPTRTPGLDPEPLRRLSPDRVCPAQKERVVRRVIRDI